MIKPEELVSLLGSSMKDPAIKAICKAHEDCDISEMDGEYDYTFEQHGFSFTFTEKILAVIMLYADGKDGFSEYSYLVPHKLKFGFTKIEVQALLGQGIESGPLFDNYRFDDHFMTVEYAGKGKPISMITLMTLEASES